MFSRFFGKRDSSAAAPDKEAQDTRAPDAAKDHAPSTWSTWAQVTVAKDSAKDSAGSGRPDGHSTFGHSTFAPSAFSPSAFAPSAFGASAFTPAGRSGAATGVPFPKLDPVATKAADLPAENQIDFELPTAPMSLEPELTLAQRRDQALAIVEQHHVRIANTIRTLWGFRDCSVYINRLIMAGGDGMGQARVGFNQEAAAAMLALSDVHDEEFGPPSTLGGALGVAI